MSRANSTPMSSQIVWLEKRVVEYKDGTCHEITEEVYDYICDVVNDLNADIAALEAENAALREAQRWIPVCERLPEMGIEIITWDGDEIISDRLLEPDGGKIGFSLTGAGQEVTHWMPLPSPPEEIV